MSVGATLLLDSGWAYRVTKKIIEQQAESFQKIFSGLKRAYGVLLSTEGTNTRGKVEARYMIKRQASTITQWIEHLEGTAGMVPIPIRDDGCINFGAIDVDVYDGLDVVGLQRKIQELKLPLTVCMSKSGGVHLYVFMKHPTLAREVVDALQHWALVLGFPGVEIFPKQISLSSEMDVGSGIGVPYYGGQESTQYAIDPINTEPMSVDQFIEHVETVRVTPADFPEIDLNLPEFDGAPPCVLRNIMCGMAEGGRNNGLFDCGVFARAKYPDDYEDRLRRWNQDYCDEALPDREVTAMLKSIQRSATYSYRAKCQGPFCDPAKCRAAEYGRQNLPNANEHVGSAPSVTIDKVVKVMTEPPTYILTVEGENVEGPIDMFINQSVFIRTVADRLQKIPARMKAGAFSHWMNDKLQSADIEEAPEDATPAGMVKMHLIDFFKQRAVPDRERVSMGNVYYDDEEMMYYFRSHDFIDHLKRHRVFGMIGRDLWNIMRHLGAVDARLRYDDSVHRVWKIELDQKSKLAHLPTPEFEDNDDAPY